MIGSPEMTWTPWNSDAWTELCIKISGHHVNVWQKTLQYCKVISLQPIKINGKKRKEKKKSLGNFEIYSIWFLSRPVGSEFWRTKGRVDHGSCSHHFFIIVMILQKLLKVIMVLLVCGPVFGNLWLSWSNTISWLYLMGCKRIWESVW